MTAAALLAYAATQVFGVHHGQWAVITCLVVVQASFAGTWDASLSRVYGTVLGALAGGGGVLGRQWTGLLEIVVLGLAIAPLAALSATDPRFRLAPVTAGLVMLTASNDNAAAHMIFDRTSEIMLGVTVGVLCTFLILPERANAVLRRSAADAVEAMGEIAQAHLRHDSIEAFQLRVDAAFTMAQAATAEVIRGQALGLVKGQSPQLFMTALRRLRTNVALIERAMEPACSAVDRACLASTVAAWFMATAAALRAGNAVPEPPAFSRAPGVDQSTEFDALEFALTALQREQSNFSQRATDLG